MSGDGARAQRWADVRYDGGMTTETKAKPPLAGCLILIVAAVTVAALVRWGLNAGARAGRDAGEKYFAEHLTSASAVAAAPAVPAQAPKAELPTKPVETAAPSGGACTLSIPGQDVVPVFISEDRFEAFARGSDARTAGGVAVDSGTRCSIVDFGISKTKIMVTEGPKRGLVGWVPTEWRSGN